MQEQLQGFNLIRTARERPRVAIGQLIYILIWLGLIGVIIWYIVKQSIEYDEALDNPYITVSVIGKDEIVYPVITICNYGNGDDEPQPTLRYFGGSNVKEPKMRHFTTTNNFKCVIINEDLKSKAKTNGYSERLGDFELNSNQQTLVFYTDEKKVNRKPSELADLSFDVLQIIPDGAFSYISFTKVITKDLDDNEKVYFNYTVDIAVPYCNQEPKINPSLINPSTTDFNFKFQNMHEIHYEERVALTELDLVGNIFGFIGLLFQMFAWVHLLILGPWIAGLGFRSVWTAPQAK
jgi:hypothetical protein